MTASISCEDYLDKSPDLGQDESVVYDSYESMRGYIDRAYLQLNRWNTCIGEMGMSGTMNSMAHTDELSSQVQEENFLANNFHYGNWYSTNRNSNWEVGVSGSTVIASCYQALRIANKAIAGMDNVKNITDEQKKWLIGQAHFYRAWYYYNLITRYGGMPKFDHAFNGGDDNVPRMTYRQSHDWMMEDIEIAIANLPDYWDDSNYGRPDKAAALGFKAQALLYAASPLFQNGLSSTEKLPYDKQLCLDAAAAAQACIDFIAATPACKRELTQIADKTTMDDYHGIFVLEKTDYAHPEYLWWDRWQGTAQNMNNTLLRMWLWAEFNKNTGNAAQQFCSPTANIVEYYERKGTDGKYYPITDPRSGYVPVVADDPESIGPWSNMQNRDPRMYANLLFPGERWGTHLDQPYYICSWEGSPALQTIKAGNASGKREFGGWMCQKYIWPEASQTYKTSQTNTEGFDLKRIRSFFIRVSEMYLDYAEALFEATGSATTKPDGFSMTPKEALDIIRARVGVTPIVDDLATPDKFRETYRRERAVELMFEGNHRWEDIRRWMIFDEVFPTTSPIYRYEWTCLQNDVATSANPAPLISSSYNDGKNLTFTYKKVKNNSEVRVYTDKNYLYPFPGAELGSLSLLKQNPGW